MIFAAVGTLRRELPNHVHLLQLPHQRGGLAGLLPIAGTELVETRVALLVHGLSFLMVPVDMQGISINKIMQEIEGMLGNRAGLATREGLTHL